MSIIVRLILFLGYFFISSLNHLSAQTNSLEHISNARAYYWLARTRSNAVYEAKIALKYLDSARYELGVEEKNSLELIKSIDDLTGELNALIDISMDNMNGKYPLYMHLTGELREEYELRDEPIEISIEDGIQALLDANNNVTKKPLSDLNTFCIVQVYDNSGGNFEDSLVLTEVVRQYLTNNSLFYVLSDEENNQVGLITKNKEGIIDSIGKLFSTTQVGFFKVNILNRNPALNYVGVTFEYYDVRKNSLLASNYYETFKQDKTAWFKNSFNASSDFSAWLIFMLFPIIGFLLFFKKDRFSQQKSITPGLIGTLLGGLLGILIFFITPSLISFLAPSPDTFLAEPKAIAWPLIFSLITFILSPILLFLIIPLVSDKYFLNLHASCFSLLSSLNFGVLIGYNLEYAKYFEETLPLSMLLYYAAITVLASYLLTHFYISYYRRRLSLFHLYKSLLIMLIYFPVSLYLFELEPTGTFNFSKLLITPFLLIPYGIVYFIEKKGISKKHIAIVQQSPLERIISSITTQLNEYSENKRYVAFEKNISEIVAKELKSFDHKLSFSHFSGKSGIGKTSLIDGLRQSSPDNLSWFYGDCDEFEESKNIPYEPFYQAFYENRFENGHFADRGIFFSGKSNSTELIKKSSPALAMIPGLSISPDDLIKTVSSFGGEMSEARVDRVISSLREAFIQYLAEKTTDNRKVNIILDDIHWLDQLSFELFIALFDLMKELSDTFEYLYFHVIVIDNPNSGKQDQLEERLKTIHEVIQLNGFYKFDKISFDQIVHKHFVKYFLSYKNTACAIDEDLILEIEDFVSNREYTPRMSLELLLSIFKSDSVIYDGRVLKATKTMNIASFAIADADKKRYFELFDNLSVDLLKYLSAAAFIGMEFEAKVLSRIWNIKRLDLLHLLLEAEKNGVIFDKNDTDDIYAFTSRKIRNSLREYVTRNNLDQITPQIVRDYHLSILKIELNVNDLDEVTLEYLSHLNSFLLQKVSERAKHLVISYPEKTQLIFTATALKLFEEGKFGQAQRYANSINPKSSLETDHPNLLDIHIFTNIQLKETHRAESIYNNLYEKVNRFNSEQKGNRNEALSMLERLLDFNHRAKLNKFDFEDALTHFPKDMIPILQWYQIIGSEEVNPLELKSLEQPIIENALIEGRIKGKFINSLVRYSYIEDKNKQFELLKKRFEFIINTSLKEEVSIELFIKTYCDYSIENLSYQQIEDLAYLGGSLFKLAESKKTDLIYLYSLGQKRLLINEVLGDEIGIFWSTFTLLGLRNMSEDAPDLLEDYSVLLSKNKKMYDQGISGKPVYVYLQLIKNQLSLHAEKFNSDELISVNQTLLSAIREKPSKNDQKFNSNYVKKDILKLLDLITDENVRDVLQKILDLSR